MNKKFLFSVFLILILFLISLSVRAAWRADWSYPEADTIYNPLSTEGFETIRFAGDFYDESTWDGFFYDPENEEVIIPSLIEVRFLHEEIEPKTIIVQNLYPEIDDTQVVAENLHIDEYGLSYAFEISIPEDLFSAEENGDWVPQIHFEVAEPLNRGADITLPDNRTIKIDTRSPELAFSYNENNLSSTNKPVTVSITCDDGELGSGCFPASINPLSVKGNFHKNFLDENRGVQICDQVNNCTDFTQTKNKIQIDFYDPLPPMFTGINFKQVGGNIEIFGQGERLSAHNAFTFSIINPSDPIEINDEEYSDFFDFHACGEDNEENDLYFQQQKCASKKKKCILSAIDRNAEINQYDGEEICEFEELPERHNRCFENGRFPLCFPFNFYSNRNTLPFTLPFTLYED